MPPMQVERDHIFKRIVTLELFGSDRHARFKTGPVSVAPIEDRAIKEHDGLSEAVTFYVLNKRVETSAFH